MVTEGYGQISTKRKTKASIADEQHSLVRTVVLHLLPGALITAVYIVAAPVVRGLGFPSIMAFFLAILFVLILCPSRRICRCHVPENR